jgi:uncharacterized protein with beta-barrel porin domain
LAGWADSGCAGTAARLLKHFVFTALALLGFTLPALAESILDILAPTLLLGGRPLTGNGADGSSGTPGQVTSTLSNGAALQGGTGGTGGAGGWLYGNGGTGGGGGSGATVTGAGSSSNSGSLTGGTGGSGSNAGLFGAGGMGGTGGAGVLFTTSGALFTNTSTIIGGHGGSGGSAGLLFSVGGTGGTGGSGIAGTNLTIDNQASITGGSGGTGGTGTFLSSGGNGGNGGAGISGTGLTITNEGTITGGSGGTGSSGGANGAGGAGIAGSNLTITNVGTIAGASNGAQGNAITFTGGANTLTLVQGAILGNISVTGSLDFNQASTAILTNVITGPGSVSKSGVGLLTLLGASTYAGGTTVNAGTLQLGPGGSLASTGALTVNGGTFDLGAHVQTVGALAGSGGTIDLNGGALTAGDSTNTSFAGAIIDAGSLTKQGSGTLTLAGINTYTGNTTVNGGILAVTGSLAGNTVVNTGGTLQGTGTVAGVTVNSGGTLGGGPNGTLTMSSLVQNTGSLFQATPAGLVSVTGAATLNGGSVSVLAQSSATWQINTTYTILTAGTRTGTFAGITTNLSFLKPSLAYTGGTVTMSLAPFFEGAASTPSQAAVATALDTAVSSATGDFKTVTTALLNGAYGSSASTLLTTLSGQTYASMSTTLSQTMQTFMASTQSLGGFGGGATSSGTASLSGSTYQALRVDGPDACDTACDVEPLWGAWGGGLGAFGTVAGSSTAPGLTYNLGGFVAGLDRRFAPGVRVGVTTGFSAASLYSVGAPGYGTSNTLQFALYGEYAPGPFYLDALGGYGHSDNRMSRPITIPGLPFRLAQGYTTANTFFGQLEAGYKIPVAPAFGGFVTPFARLQASTSTQQGFSETGADSLDLTVAQQTTNSLRTVLGAQLGASVDAPWREKLDLLFRLGWSHEYADLTRPVTAAFAGAPALSFTTYGADAPRDGVVLGFGASTTVAERTSVYFRYDGDLTGGNTNHVLNAGVRYVW